MTAATKNNTKSEGNNKSSFGKNEFEEVDEIKCEKCEKGDREDELLLCDTCNRATHLHCLEPALSKMPEDGEEWFCSACLRAKSVELTKRTSTTPFKTSPDDNNNNNNNNNNNTKQKNFKFPNNVNSVRVQVPDTRVAVILYPGYEAFKNKELTVAKFGGGKKLAKAVSFLNEGFDEDINNNSNSNNVMQDSNVASMHASNVAQYQLGDDKKPLEMRFRPNDKFAIPIIGETLPAKTLVLRLSKKSLFGGSSSSAQKNSKMGDVYVEAFGRCTKQIEFRGLADFQYCSATNGTSTDETKKKNETIKKRRRVFKSDRSTPLTTTTSVANNFGKKEDELSFAAEEEEFFVDEDEIRPPQGPSDDPFKLRLKSQIVDKTLKVKPGEFQLIPPVYCKDDVPFDYFENGDRRKNREDLDAATDAQKEILVDFADASVPKAVAIESRENEPRRSALYKYLTALFKERPVWSPRGFQERLRLDVPMTIIIDQKQVRIECREFCYKFKNGPFRKLWILRGFDPRLSKACVRFQVYEVKLPTAWYGKKDSELADNVAKSALAAKTHLDFHEFRNLPKTRFPLFLVDDVNLPSVKRELQIIANSASSAAGKHANALESNEDGDIKADAKKNIHESGLSMMLYSGAGHTEYAADGTPIIHGCSEKFGFLTPSARDVFSERVIAAYTNVLDGKDPIEEDKIWVEKQEKIDAEKKAEKLLEMKNEVVQTDNNTSAFAAASALHAGQKRQRNIGNNSKNNQKLRSKKPVPINPVAITGQLADGLDGFAALNAFLEQKEKGKKPRYDTTVEGKKFANPQNDCPYCGKQFIKRTGRGPHMKSCSENPKNAKAEVWNPYEVKKMEEEEEEEEEEAIKETIIPPPPKIQANPQAASVLVNAQKSVLVNFTRVPLIAAPAAPVTDDFGAFEIFDDEEEE
jgi:hypothetical protein